MQNNRKSNSKKSILNAVSGITLIALVVTIVVLLILASVSITVVFGDNGILQLAKEAGEKTNEAVKNDISSIGELEDILHETQTGIVVEKVTDTKPGELEVDDSDGNLFIINSIEDLVAFAHNITSGNETYAGKTVKLGLSLDFASTKSYVDANRTDYGEYGYDGELKKLLNESGFIPIGTQGRTTSDEMIENTFKGTFDGNKKAIYNLRINKTVQDAKTNGNIGMFTVNNGTIQDLNIENANLNIDMQDDNNWKCVGILAAVNSKEGKIYRCSISGKISGTVLKSCDIGGIVGSTAGELSNSCSEVDMTILGKAHGIYEGLICGSCNKTGTVKNVYAKGCISPSGYGYVGSAICGLGRGEFGENAYNVYTVGKIRVDADECDEMIVGTFYISNNGNELSECYYLENNIEIIGTKKSVYCKENGTKKTEEEMKSEEFVNSLNEGQEDSPWKQDTNNINDGYPILSWQQ